MVHFHSMSVDVCRGRTTNAHLKQWIQDHGEAGQVCSVCGTEEDVAADIVKFAQHVEGVVRENTSPAPIPEPDYEDASEDAQTLIGREAGVAKPVAQFIVRIGRERDRDFYEHPLGFVGRWSAEHHSEWRRFRDVVIHEARFLGPKTQTILAGCSGTSRRSSNGSAVRTLNPGDRIYRARLERSRGEADVLFKSPETHLTAPPFDRAIAGRMNAAGDTSVLRRVA